MRIIIGIGIIVVALGWSFLGHYEVKESRENQVSPLSYSSGSPVNTNKKQNAENLAMAIHRSYYGNNYQLPNFTNSELAQMVEGAEVAGSSRSGDEKIKLEFHVLIKGTEKFISFLSSFDVGTEQIIHNFNVPVDSKNLLKRSALDLQADYVCADRDCLNLMVSLKHYSMGKLITRIIYFVQLLEGQKHYRVTWPFGVSTIAEALALRKKMTMESSSFPKAETVDILSSCIANPFSNSNCREAMNNENIGLDWKAAVISFCEERDSPIDPKFSIECDKQMAKFEK